MKPAQLVIKKFTPEPIADKGRRRSGTSVLAALLGVAQSTIHRWLATGIVPAAYHHDILKESRRLGLGLTADDLVWKG